MTRRRALVVALAGLIGLAFALPASAAERRPPPKTRKANVVSQKVFKQLGPAHDALAEERYADALKHLNRIKGMSKLTPFEQAQMWQTFGYVYSGQERYKEAQDAFEKTLATGGLNEEQTTALRFNLGQLYIANGQYRKGIETIEPYFESVQNAGPAPYFLVANAYAQLENYSKALSYVDQGLPLMKKPRENWLQLALALNFEAKRFKTCRNLLERLVTHFPKKQYWLQLASVYAELGQEKEQMAAYELAHRQGLLTTGSELVRMAQLYLYHGVPYKAGTLLESELESRRVPGTATNWELLANAWVGAREYERAVPALRRAAELSDKGALYVRLGQVHLERSEWKPAADALQAAINKGGLANTGQAHLLLGISRYNLERRDRARSAFRAAAKYEKSRRSAQQWLRVLDQEAAVAAQESQSDPG